MYNDVVRRQAVPARRTIPWAANFSGRLADRGRTRNAVFTAGSRTRTAPEYDAVALGEIQRLQTTRTDASAHRINRRTLRRVRSRLPRRRSGHVELQLREPPDRNGTAGQPGSARRWQSRMGREE